MRKIIFRGIPKDDTVRHFFADTWKENCEGSFVYGSLVVARDRYYICVSALCTIESCINNGLTSMIRVIPSSVSEFSGLYDKNGKKIFEWDVVKNIDGAFLVCWDKEKCAFIMRFLEYPYETLYLEEMWEDSEVIGNIHDNPELLRKEDEGK